MKHDDRVFGALAHRRNLGADLAAIRTALRFREKPKRTEKNDRASLGRLEKAGLIYSVGDTWFLTSAGFKQARGHARPAAWQSEDVLVFMALAISSWEEGCDLRGLIGAADYIDHGIPSLAQLHGGLNRLRAGGLVRTRRGRYLLTDKATKLLSRVEDCCRRDVRSRLHGLARMLDCPCCGVRLGKVRWPIRISEAEMQAAIERYRADFQKK